MPIKQRRYCKLCNRIATKGAYCDIHQPQRDYSHENAKRDNPWDAWEKTKLWRDKRSRHLAKEPLCRECLKVDLYVKAEEVDHIIPHRGDWNLFIDEDNLQSLCKVHHSQKTARENKRRRN